jgi:hypothetical protein
MKHPNLEREYGVVRFECSVQCRRREELIFQSDNPAETMEQLEKESRKNGAVYQHKIILKDGNS